jgi:hypothetical protein
LNLEFRNDTNLMTSDQEPGSFFNAGKDIVLLRMPDLAELQNLWNDFNRELRSSLKELFLTPYGQVTESLGLLGFRAKEAEARRSVLYGMLTSGSPRKSVHFRKSAIAKALITLDLIPDTTPHGRTRSRGLRGEGSVENYALAMPSGHQRALIEALIDTDDIDSWLLVSQGSSVGWRGLNTSLTDAADAAVFLHELAEATERLMGDRDRRTKRHANPSELILFSPAWFSQYLAKRGIWVWPARYVTRVLYLYPSRLLPLLTRVSVGKEKRQFADEVFQYHQDQRNTGASVSIQAFAAAALCANTWRDHEDGFRWYPLAAFKEAVLAMASATHLSTSINAVYRLAAEHFGADLSTRPEAKLFLLSMRLGQLGVDAFNWTSNPTPRNTRVAEKLLGEAITSVPHHVQSWAAQLRELLPLFQVKNINQVEHAMNLWLIYLMTVEADAAPIDLQSVSRPLHVHDLRGINRHTFRTFLDSFYRDNARDLGNRALSTMQKAFRLAALRDGFQDQTNPFDPKLDRISNVHKKKNDATPRKPLELEAWEFIVRKNRENDFAFARSLGPKRFHYTLRNPDTGKYETVFWPAEPIIIDIILNSGLRHVSARWVDSGEGDQYVIDRQTMTRIPNPHPSATLGRSEAFLQLVSLPGRERRKVIGMNVIINKTGKPYVIPWSDADVVESVYRILELQRRYNPIRYPVKPLKNKTRDVTRGNPDLYQDIYPLFRDPAGAQNAAVSETKVLAYWKDLLRECQPAVNKLFGYDYPLVDDDGLVFDLHSLRVTMVSNLLEAGVSLELVRDLVGHATWIMTWHYNGRRSAMLHTAMQKAMEARSQAHDRLASGNHAAIEEYANEAVTPEFVPDHIGKRMLREYARRSGLAPFDVFLHGICPGGTCATGGEKIAEGRFKPVWRERACSGCRYRVTGVKFKPGILNRINNLQAEMRLSAKRAQELSLQIEQIEAKEGKAAHALRRTQGAESSLRDHLAKEYGLELRTLAIITEVEKMATEAGTSAEKLLLPAVGGLDPEKLECGFAECHEFELMHTLVKETRILPAAIMEIPHGVEASLKTMVREILRANDISELMFRLSPSQETDACIQIGDILLDKFPETARFQQLVEGALRLDSNAMLTVRSEIDSVLAGRSSPHTHIEGLE